MVEAKIDAGTGHGEVALGEGNLPRQRCLTGQDVDIELVGLQPNGVAAAHAFENFGLGRWRREQAHRAGDAWKEKATHHRSL